MPEINPPYRLDPLQNPVNLQMPDAVVLLPHTAVHQARCLVKNPTKLFLSLFFNIPASGIDLAKFQSYRLLEFGGPPAGHYPQTSTIEIAIQLKPGEGPWIAVLVILIGPTLRVSAPPIANIFGETFGSGEMVQTRKVIARAYICPLDQIATFIDKWHHLIVAVDATDGLLQTPTVSQWRWSSDRFTIFQVFSDNESTPYSGGNYTISPALRFIPNEPGFPSNKAPNGTGFVPMFDPELGYPSSPPPGSYNGPFYQRTIPPGATITDVGHLVGDPGDTEFLGPAPQSAVGKKAHYTDLLGGGVYFYTSYATETDYDSVPFVPMKIFVDGINICYYEEGHDGRIAVDLGLLLEQDDIDAVGEPDISYFMTDPAGGFILKNTELAVPCQTSPAPEFEFLTAIAMDHRYSRLQIWFDKYFDPSLENVMNALLEIKQNPDTRKWFGNPVPLSVARTRFGAPSVLLNGSPAQFINNRGSIGAFTLYEVDGRGEYAPRIVQQIADEIGPFLLVDGIKVFIPGPRNIPVNRPASPVPPPSP